MPSSPLYPGEFVIHDTTPDEHYRPPVGQSTGLELPPAHMRGYAGVAEPFPRELVYPRSEFQARIKELEEQKSRISDISVAAGLPCKDQNGTNYCWINAPTHCVEVIRVVQNEPMVILSPASAGAQIKGYRNQGGWGKEGLEWIVEHGLDPIDIWPANAINRKYATAEAKVAALKYRVTEWWELDPNDIDQLISCLLRRLPCALGFNWWSHEVSGVDPVWLDGEVALRIRNSWGMGWGDKGFGILQGRKMRPDDAVCPRVALAA